VCFFFIKPPFVAFWLMFDSCCWLALCRSSWRLFILCPIVVDYDGPKLDRLDTDSGDPCVWCMFGNICCHSHSNVIVIKL
jgi:hypothetical protein